MATMTLLGLMFGNFISGYVGDTLGRRAPTIWCYITSTVIGFVCAFMPTFYCLVVARALLGIGMGFGMPPAGAMISETTPEQWRIMMRVGSSCCFSLGFLFITLLAAFDDPSYKHAHWRHLMLIAAVPPACFSVLATLFLHESPVFLAAAGRHAEAKQVFRSTAWWNSTEHLDLDYDEGPRTGAPGNPSHASSRATMWDQLGMVFAPHLRYTTVAVFLAAFCINLVSYGDGYAAPQVLTVTSHIAPAWQCVIKASVSVLWVFLAGALAQVMSRKTMVILATVISSTVCFAFALAGSFPAPRSMLMEILFQYGANGSAVGSALGYVVVFQIAVEIYPTSASTTGGALIMGGGRLAAVAAPLLFENVRRYTGKWTPFYYLLGFCCAVAAAFALFMNPIKAYRPGEEFADDLESVQTSFKVQTDVCYGTSAKNK
uniref:Major facilitator superfamily (MFS) profile domain-containing protein n=1 Tax=Alexandrium andersonii TaxID=327968 RepID=A0A7S2AJQ6_9DINO|mmetsp:Transcript_13718/g.31093  ORF Transcript_13718/g.31093 Transcript_13718/m.31093 type:complete len:431 (+) Transcript_13718:1-1293(+)